MTKNDVWNLALDLIQKQIGAERTKYILDLMLKLADEYQTIPKIYERFCNSAQNRWRLPQVIGWIEKQPDMQKALNYFDIKKNKGWDEEKFYYELTANTLRGRNANLTSPRNIWRQYAGSLADITNYLSSYIDENNTAIRFRQFITERVDTKEHAWQVAVEISELIRGMRATLVCDTLKEIGFTQYSKPDQHITKIFNELGYSQSDDAKDIFYSVWDFSNEINMYPSQVDKIFWLIGSGHYHMFNDEKHPRLLQYFLKAANS